MFYALDEVHYDLSSYDLLFGPVALMYIMYGYWGGKPPCFDVLLGYVRYLAKVRGW